MKSKIELQQRGRPCLLAGKNKALFYGFNEYGNARVELESGKIYLWDCAEVELLDSKEEFSQWNWDVLLERREQANND